MDSISQIINHMGPPAIAVASTLLLMALASLAIFFERLFTCWRSRAASRAFAAEARALLEADDTEGLVRRAETNKGHLARLLCAGAKTYLASKEKPSSLSPVEATLRSLQRPYILARRGSVSRRQSGIGVPGKGSIARRGWFWRCFD